jgi:hypothetical protein
VNFFMGSSLDPLGEIPLRFTGVCDTVERHGGDERASQVTLRFLDYTTFFLKNKHFPSEGVPKFQETLPQIWAKICDNTGYYDIDTGHTLSSVTALRDRIVIIGIDENTTLASTTTSRVTRFGQFVVRDGDSAWDIWIRAVGALGLVSWIELDQVIVAPTTEHFAEGNGPRLVLGDNIVEWSEKVDSSISDKGVGIQSINTITGKLLESFYPPPGDPRIHVKRVKAGKKAGNPTKPNEIDFQSDHYDIYLYHDIADQRALDRKAQQVYAERCRQEVQGHIKTGEFTVEDGTGADFDLLKLHAGDPIRIELSPDYEELLRSQGDEDAQVQYLLQRGQSETTAALIARNLDALPALKPIYHVKQLRVSLDEGRFEIEIYYHNNKIQPLGDTDDKP